MKNRYGALFALLMLVWTNMASSQEQDSSRYFWRHFVVDQQTPVGTSTALAYGSNGFPQIAYRIAGHDGTKGVKFARFDGKDWLIMTVDSEGQGRVALALDSSDRPHIIYQANEGTRLMHARLTGSTWTTELIDGGLRDNGYYSIDLKVDSQDRFHMVYARHVLEEFSFERMTYAYWENGNIVSDIAIVEGFSGKWASLALDADGRPAASFYNFNGDLAFSYQEQGVWKPETIDETGFFSMQGYYSSMQYGPDGNFYIAFQNQSDSKLRLAKGQPGQWQIEDVADLSGWEVFATPNPLILDRSGNPHIAFYDKANADLLLAARFDGKWHIETVDTAGNVGQWASMALTSEGTPAISFYDATQGVLRLSASTMSTPQESDGDDIPDYLEAIHGTDPFDADSDDDGLSDGEEDQNQNGKVDAFETDPLNPDTDGDGLLDGVELGRTDGIPAMNDAAGTDMTIFHGDGDPGTQTNPLMKDTDGDMLADGAEDQNGNGVVDFDESDPNNRDTDADGILDGFEVRLGSSPIDIDSDDDGLADIDEDANANGIVDENETNPSLFDTDDDGLSDGLERGRQVGIADPDGVGRLRGTNYRIFKPDADPMSNSNPTLWDTDGDGLSDGEEDSDHNGQVDEGETHFLSSDSDGDGAWDGDEIFFGSDPLNKKNRARVDAILDEDFADNNLGRWEIIDNGKIAAPSDWQVYEHALMQTSNIWDGAEFPGASVANKPGTLIWARDFSGTDFKMTCTIRSNDDDEFGVLFRFLDNDNYYRFSMDSEQGYRRLTKIVHGKASVIATEAFAFEPQRDYAVVVYAIGPRLQIFLDGRRVFDIEDASLTSGSIAFFTWKNDAALFKDVHVYGDGTLSGLENELLLSGKQQMVHSFQLSPAYPNPTTKDVNFFLLSANAVSIQARVVDILGRTVRNFDIRGDLTGAYKISWDGRDDRNAVLPTGVYYFQIRAVDPDNAHRILWQDIKKIVRLK